MIDMMKIFKSAQQESLNTLISSPAFPVDEEIAEASEIKVQSAQMKFALELLEQYHKALQEELRAYQIEI